MLQVLDFNKDKVLVMFIVIISSQNYELFDWAMLAKFFKKDAKYLK